MENNGYIRLHRSITEWELFSDDKTFKLFIYLLLSANWEDKTWKGMTVKRGELITSLQKLSRDLGYSLNEIRYRLQLLDFHTVIVKKCTHRFTQITICDYDAYQDSPHTEPHTNHTLSHTKSTTTKEEEYKYTSKYTEEDKRKKKYKRKKKNQEIYKEEVLKANDDVYAKFVAFLNGNNSLNRELTECLSLPQDPITYQRFQNLMAKYPRKLIAEKTLAIETHRDTPTKKKSLSQTLHDWCRKEINTTPK